jgi:hypothetical protein
MLMVPEKQRQQFADWARWSDNNRQKPLRNFSDDEDDWGWAP